MAPDPPLHPAEDEHRSMGHGGLRAAVFGASDGLVSNTALVLGVAAGSADARLVALAGVAGLLAGAASMAAGEWISVTAQREALQRELKTEEEHLERYPDAEKAHIQAVLRKAGISEDLARQVALDLESDARANLEFHARLELGIDPDELGSPILAASVSFVAFSVGALLPLLPWLVDAPAPLLLSAGLATIALFAVGATLARFTGRSPWISGMRQLGVGAVATGLTTAIGSLFGV